LQSHGFSGKLSRQLKHPRLKGKEQMDKIKVLYIGDSEIVMSRYIIGADVFEQANYNDNGHFFRDAMATLPDIDVKHIIAHDVPYQFPKTLEELEKFDVIIFSDVGYNSMIFYTVENGGGFLMSGGYVSFAGLNAIAGYFNTPIEEILPVNIFTHDDRVEATGGFMFNALDKDHPIMADIPWDNAKFTLCGYNQVTLKDGAKLLAEYDGDPFITCWEYKKGRTATFASDFAPHWAGDFIDWEFYPQFWGQMMRWLAGKT
jgi:uncharacterized membrane protein